jgi:hypothetical protein
MNPVLFGFSSRKLVKSPTEKNPTTGQKRISKRLNTFRFAMIQFLNTKAHVWTSGFAKFFDDIFRKLFFFAIGFFT